MDISPSSFPEMRNRIFEALAESNLSQKEFAKKIQIVPQTVTDWKKGKSSSFVGKLGAIAVVLNVAPLWLAFGEGEKHLSQEQLAQLLINESSEALDVINAATKRLERFTRVDIVAEDKTQDKSKTIFMDETLINIANAYAQAEPGIQAAVRKLLDVEVISQESGRAGEAM